jgi:F420-0:gamma-glutamyl ligase
LIQSIASQAVSMAQENVQQEASLKVAKMALDAAEKTGNALVEMIAMQKEIYQHLGQNINTWV